MASYSFVRLTSLHFVFWTGKDMKANQTLNPASVREQNSHVFRNWGREEGWLLLAPPGSSWLHLLLAH